MNKSHCKHGIVKTDCEICTTENIRQRYSSVQSSELLDLAHEIWVVAQLLPGEGIVDGVDRIVDVLKSNDHLFK